MGGREKGEKERKRVKRKRKRERIKEKKLSFLNGVQVKHFHSDRGSGTESKIGFDGVRAEPFPRPGRPCSPMMRVMLGSDGTQLNV